mmetsp:Transcript_22607/g.65066  ORF Transcript_22607/g.65066 Transcript_22607/m.65066 type:complete len:519 (-) Transcript_22607:51-1607(-)
MAPPHDGGLWANEATPLDISSSFRNDDAELGQTTMRDSNKRHRPHSTRMARIRESLMYDELKGMTTLAVPVVATYLLEFFPGLVSIVLVGHLHSDKTEEYIDATALSVAFMNLCGLSIGIGLSTAMDTLCSQAYGAGETEKMGVYLQTGVIVLAVFSICIGITFYNATNILLALGQPAEVSELTGEAVWILLWGVPFMFAYELLRKVLQAQNIAAPMFWVSIGANIVNAGVGYVLTYHSNYGWLGASIARSVCNCSFIVLLLPYVMSSGLVKTFWNGFHLREAFDGIPQFLALGLPGAAQLCFEWWAFEVIGLICGLLPDAVVDIGANAIMMNINALMFMFYLGLSVSGNVRIGNALGAADPKRARVAALGSIGMCAAMATLLSTFLLLSRRFLPLLFTHDETIGDLASTLIVVAAIFQLPDAVNGSIQGIFRGSGRQNIGAQLNFAAYYLLGIPFGCILAFTFGLGVVGLWIGMTVALTIIAIVGTTLVVTSDWAKLSKDARSRVHNSKSWNNLLEA